MTELTERVQRRLDAVKAVVAALGQYPHADWGDQMSALAAIGHTYCGSHPMWKLPNGHPAPASPDRVGLERREDLYAKLAPIFRAMPWRDRDDVLSAAGEILFDTEWLDEDYDSARHDEEVPDG